MTQVPFKNLTPRQRRAYILRFRRGWRLRRIAAELGIAVSSAGELVKRALAGIIHRRDAEDAENAEVTSTYAQKHEVGSSARCVVHTSQSSTISLRSLRLCGESCIFRVSFMPGWEKRRWASFGPSDGSRGHCH
jgi:hypothetical protein